MFVSPALSLDSDSAAPPAQGPGICTLASIPVDSTYRVYRLTSKEPDL